VGAGQAGADVLLVPKAVMPAAEAVRGGPDGDVVGDATVTGAGLVRLDPCWLWLLGGD
jgi:hypothetical protein